MTKTPDMEMEYDDTDVKKVKDYVLKIRVEHSDLVAAKQQAKYAYDTEIKRISVALIELQKRCPHVRTEHHSDASGNNDSSDECLDCGKEDKRLN